MGRQDFDADGSRSLGPIWPTGEKSQAVTQSLRCYSPADFRLLLESTGLALETYEPYEGECHETRVPLEQALLYLTKLVPERWWRGRQKKTRRRTCSVTRGVTCCLSDNQREEDPGGGIPTLLSVRQPPQILHGVCPEQGGSLEASSPWV
jgi:hypothetical protein